VGGKEQGKRGKTNKYKNIKQKQNERMKRGKTKKQK
jgi:hypothetical protein